MTNDQQQKKPSSTPVVDTTNSSVNNTPEAMVMTLKTKINQFFSSWKIKLTLIIAIIIGIFTLTFFWQHLVAVWGMKQWSARSGATPIECMIKDTNDDHYISCSAIREGQIIPLECGANILNLGCRVNYGTAVSPPVSGRR